MSVLVVGSVALDSVSTPFGTHEEMLGGSATYFSVAASHFSPVSIVAVVGEDFPEKYKAMLQDHGINIAGLQVKPGKTFRWAGEYKGSMNEALTRDTQLNVFQGFNPVIPEEYKSIKWVFLGNIDPVLQMRVLEQIPRAELIALDTMNFWIEGNLPALLDVLKKIDLLIINEGELHMLSGELNLQKAAHSVCGMGPRTLVIKRGEYGAVLYQEDKWFIVPGYPEAEVKDPTGAGDSFAGGFMGYLARSGNPTWDNFKTAMVQGSIMASYNITAFGPWRLTELSPDMIESRFRAFQTLVSF